MAEGDFLIDLINQALNRVTLKIENKKISILS
jgi:hypothetical protein